MRTSRKPWLSPIMVSTVMESFQGPVCRVHPLEPLPRTCSIGSGCQTTFRNEAMRSVILSIERAIGATLVVAIFASCEPSESYRKFVHHDRQYYSQLASACDSLLAHAPLIDPAEQRRFARETNSLPSIIRELHPYCIGVHTNVVLIRCEEGQLSCSITWRQSDSDTQLWILGAETEGSSCDVYSRRKP